MKTEEFYQNNKCNLCCLLDKWTLCRQVLMETIQQSTISLQWSEEETRWLYFMAASQIIVLTSMPANYDTRKQIHWTSPRENFESIQSHFSGLKENLRKQSLGHTHNIICVHLELCFISFFQKSISSEKQTYLIFF